jgi:branched-subunit amino acid transport protein
MRPGETDPWTLAVIAGLALVTLVSRCFFFILDRAWTLPPWAPRPLQYAPVAALAGGKAPEVVIAQEHLVATWHDARLYGAAVGAAVYFWRRSVLFTLLAGMAVYLPLHIGLGW